jgi:hypothetical protein
VTANTAYAATQGARGGGIFAGDGAYVTYSTVSGNIATSAGPGGIGIGGGIYTKDGAYIFVSTIDSNHAERGGGIYQQLFNPNIFLNVLSSSTISGNTASLSSGGVKAWWPMRVYNCTIAFNSAPVAGGIFAQDTVLLQSTILALNSSSAGAVDLYMFAPSSALTATHNLVGSSNVALPIDTIRADPQLTPLGDHGGETQTHALDPGSPAIDTGYAVKDLFDQRGLPRDVPAGFPDIGSYERQAHDDEVFYAGFN